MTAPKKTPEASQNKAKPGGRRLLHSLSAPSVESSRESTSSQEPEVRYCDVMTWKGFLHYWPFVMGIHRWPVDSHHKGPVMRCRALILCVVSWKDLLHKEPSCLWFFKAMTLTKRWDVTVMVLPLMSLSVRLFSGAYHYAVLKRPMLHANPGYLLYSFGKFVNTWSSFYQGFPYWNPCLYEIPALAMASLGKSVLCPIITLLDKKIDRSSEWSLLNFHLTTCRLRWQEASLELLKGNFHRQSN